MQEKDIKKIVSLQQFIMKKIIFALLFVAFLTQGTSAQTFSCEKLQADIATWNQLDIKDNVEMAADIRDLQFYRKNTDGSLEFAYILRGKDSLDVATLRQIAFDFIDTYFPDMSKKARANMQEYSPQNGVFFETVLSNLGEFEGYGTYSRIDANVAFEIRCKSDVILFSISIDNYKVRKEAGPLVVQKDVVSIGDTYPLNEESDHKKSYAMAFINLNSKCMNYASYFYSFVERSVAGE